MPKVNNFKRGTIFAMILLFVSVISLLGFNNVKAAKQLNMISNIAIDNNEVLEKDHEYTITVDYLNQQQLEKDDYFILSFPKQLTAIETTQKIKIDNKEIADLTINKDQLKWVYTTNDTEVFLNKKDSFSFKVKTSEKVENQDLNFVLNNATKFVVNIKNNENNNKEESTVDNNEKDKIKNEDKTSYLESNSKKRSTLQKQEQRDGTNIIYLDGADELYDTKEGKSIFSKVELYKDGKLIDNSTPITLSDKIEMRYYFDIPERLGRNIIGGDFFKFNLPEEFKVANNVLGAIVDPVDGDLFGRFTISAETGEANIFFTDKVKDNSNVAGNIKFSVNIDAKNIINSGKNEIEVPFVSDDKTISPIIKVDNKQLIEKSRIDAIKDSEITNNKTNIRWQILANKGGFIMDNPVVSDALPKGVSYLDNGNFKVYACETKVDHSGLVNPEVCEEVTGISPKIDGQNITVELTSVNANTKNKAYKIQFDTQVDLVEAGMKSSSDTSTQSVKITNEAKLKSDGQEEVKGSTSTTISSASKLTKSVNKDFGTNGYQKLGQVKDGIVAVTSWKINFEKIGLDLLPGTKMKDILPSNFASFSDEKGNKLSLDQLQTLLQEQFNANGKNQNKTLKLSQVNKDIVIEYPQGISDSFEFNYYLGLSGLITSNGNITNNLKWNNQNHNPSISDPNKSTGSKTYKKIENTDNSQTSQVQWTISINREYKNIDSWYVIDKMSNNTINDLEKSLVVKEYKDSKDKTGTTLQSTQYSLSNVSTNSFRIDYKNNTSSRFEITYLADYDKDFSGKINNSFEYHYLIGGSDNSHNGNSGFDLNPQEAYNLDLAKEGEFEAGTNDQKDKVLWTITINDSNKKFRDQAMIYDSILKNQTFDESFTPVLIKVDKKNPNNNQEIKLNLNNDSSKLNLNEWRYFKPLETNNNFNGLKINANNNANGLLMVGNFLKDSNDTYKIQFKTILGRADNNDNATQTVKNTVNYQDSNKFSTKADASLEVNRSKKVIYKSHGKDFVDENGQKFIPYQIQVNANKDKLKNVVVKDSKWQNIKPVLESVKIIAFDKTGKNLGEVDKSKYEITRTEQDMIFNLHDLNEIEYLIQYNAKVVIEDQVVNDQVQAVNVASISANELQEEVIEDQDGWNVSVDNAGGEGIGQTFNFSITKVNEVNQQQTLSNATFRLYRVQVDTINNKLVARQDTKGNYIADSVMPIVNDQQITNESGKIDYSKLRLGYYFLVETKAPTGYQITKQTNNLIYNDQLINGQLIEILNENDSNQNYKITNKPITKLKVVKKWDDNDNKEQARVDTIKVQLYARVNNQETTINDPVELKLNEQTNNLEYEFKDLDAYKLNENNKYEKIEYFVKEVEIPTDYQPTYTFNDDASIETITNVYQPKLINKSVVKEWNDNDNRLGKRPESIVVQLYANDKLVNREDAQVTLSAQNNWSYQWQDLLKQEYGKEINYTIKEVLANDDYKAYYTTTVDGFKIINALKVVSKSETDYSVKKVWQDNNNLDKQRPAAIEVQLYANNQKYGDSIILNESNNWQYNYAHLPKQQNNQDIVYSVKEVTNLKSYQVAYQQNGNQFIITNTEKIVLPKTVTPENPKSLKRALPKTSIYSNIALLFILLTFIITLSKIHYQK